MTRFARRFPCLLSLLPATLLLCLALSGAQQPPATPQETPLNQIAWFVGGTWTAKEPTDNGSFLIVKFTCRWTDTHQAILFNVWFETGGKTTPQYDGMYIWHPGKNKLTLWQVNRKGEVAEGELTVIKKRKWTRSSASCTPTVLFTSSRRITIARAATPFASKPFSGFPKPPNGKTLWTSCTSASAPSAKSFCTDFFSVYSTASPEVVR